MGIPSMRILVAALTLLGLSVTPLSATELRVYSGGAPQETLKLLAPEFEKTTGHRVAFTFAVVGAIRQRLEAGEKADVVRGGRARRRSEAGCVHARGGARGSDAGAFDHPR